MREYAARGPQEPEGIASALAIGPAARRLVRFRKRIYPQRNNFRVTIAEGGEAGLRSRCPATLSQDSPAPDFLRMALELGAARCLRKPFTPHALLAAINDCLAEHRPRSDIATAVQLG